MVFTLGITATAKEYHVAKTGNDANPGTLESPLHTIQAAANLAQAGDVITVHEGIYREWVNPIRGGESDDKRIVYRAAAGEKVQIKGSDVITNWKKVKDNVWKVVIPNSFFKDYNPFQDLIFGDWFNDLGRKHHTGEVFINGKSLYEKETIEKVYNPVLDSKVFDPEGATYTWYCKSDSNTTTIWANFQKFNPNKELVEISTRKTVFYPKKPGINYITLSGFHISQAATQWGAPTAEQVGMVATHWNKGWIIENNVISDSKCSGITLGKERSTGHNVWSADEGSINRDGNIHYIEVTFNTLRHGWNKENIGSHIVRGNTIFNCEQTGICGSMGAAYSTIENNHIYNICTKRQFTGWEIAGIKFHAGIDATIKNNRIHNTGIGIWLDWMTQGTRVSSSLFYDNNIDLFLEVNHGPYIVDNNIFLSPLALDIQSEGGAFAHNLVAGATRVRSDHNRFTPYHLPHSTSIKALATIRSGDDRYYNNVFIGKGKKRNKNVNYGLKTYEKAVYPVSINDNVYYNGALPYKGEKNFLMNSDYNPEVTLEEVGEEVYLSINLDAKFNSLKGKLINTSILGKTIVPKVGFENPDGTPISFDTDFYGDKRFGDDITVGPFNNLKNGMNKLKVW